MQSCSITIISRAADHPEASDDQQWAGEPAVIVRASPESAGFEFVSGEPISLSDLEQSLEFTYLAGVRDSGGDLDMAIARYRAMRRGDVAHLPSAAEVTAALEAGGSIVTGAAHLKIDTNMMMGLIVRHRIEWPRASVSADPPLAEMLR